MNKTTSTTAALLGWLRAALGLGGGHGSGFRRSKWADQYSGAAQVVATEADRLNGERLVVVPVVVALSWLGAIDAAAVGSLGQYASADSRTDSSPGVLGACCLTPASVAFKTLLGVVVPLANVCAAVDAVAHGSCLLLCSLDGACVLGPDNQLPRLRELFAKPPVADDVLPDAEGFGQLANTPGFFDCDVEYFHD